MTRGYVRTGGASDYMGIPVPTLIQWRKQGIGPIYIQRGPRSIFYALDDLDAWMREGRIDPATGKPLAELTAATG